MLERSCVQVVTYSPSGEEVQWKALRVGFGPTTVGLVDRRSVQLSYRSMLQVVTTRPSRLPAKQLPETAVRVSAAAPRAGDQNADGSCYSHHDVTPFIAMKPTTSKRALLISVVMSVYVLMISMSAA